MSGNDGDGTRKQMLWGLVLIALGILFLLDRMAVVEVYSLWHYWPLLLAVSGVIQLISYTNLRECRHGVWSVFIGLWLFACFEHVFGLSFRNSWPLFLLMWGLEMVLSPLIARRIGVSKENDHA